jgi:hypothetical protein
MPTASSRFQFKSARPRCQCFVGQPDWHGCNLGAPLHAGAFKQEWVKEGAFLGGAFAEHWPCPRCRCGSAAHVCGHRNEEAEVVEQLGNMVTHMRVLHEVDEATAGEIQPICADMGAKALSVAPEIFKPQFSRLTAQSLRI